MILFQYSYEQMRKKLTVLEQEFPGKLCTRVLEMSADGRGIMEVMLGNPFCKHHLLIQAGMHGREYLNTALVMRQMEDWLKGDIFGPAKESEAALNQVCLHILPMVNPDGCTISQEGPKGIREKALRQEAEVCCAQAAYAASGLSAAEYFRSWKANARGVDINRNFDAGWQEYAGPLKPCEQGFRGERPGGEAETKAVLKVGEEYPLNCCLSYHSSGGLLYWDYGSTGSLRQADKKLAEALGRITGYELQSTVIDQTDGAGCSDYFVQKYGIPAVTIETGTAKCPLPAEEFPGIYARNRMVWRAAALFCTKVE